MSMTISVLPGPPKAEPSTMRERTKYTLRLTEAPDQSWEAYFQEAHRENLHSKWFPFDISGDEVSFECPPSELQEQLARLTARTADANSLYRTGGHR